MKLVCSVFVLFLQWLSLVNFICSLKNRKRNDSTFFHFDCCQIMVDDENCSIHFYHDFSYNCFANISEKSVHCSFDI